MNPIASGVDKIKGFIHDLVKGRDYSSRRNPVFIISSLFLLLFFCVVLSSSLFFLHWF